MCAEKTEKLDGLTNFYHQVKDAINEVERMAMDNRELKRIERPVHCPFCKLQSSMYEENRWLGIYKGRTIDDYLDFGKTALITRKDVARGIELLTKLLEQLPDPKVRYFRNPDGKWIDHGKWFEAMKKGKAVE